MSNITINGLRFKEWQSDVFATLKHIEDDGVKSAFVLCKSKRQCGKSIMAEQIALYYSINEPKQKSIIISPTLKQSRKMFKDICDGLGGSGVIANANASLLEIRFVNGSDINFLSAEQKESLRGYTISKHGILIVDEASYIPDDVWGVFTPFTNVHARPTLVISTPRYCTGMFYDLWVSDAKNVFRVDWNEYDTSEFLNADVLDFYRRTLPRNQFVMDYEGRFASLSSDLFGDLSAVVNESPQLTGRYYMGVDWATNRGTDYNAVSIFNELGQMVDVEQWNGLDETQTIERIVRKVREWRPLKCSVELNSIGNIYLSLLEKEMNRSGVNYCELVGFLTTNESKNDIVNRMQVAIQNKEVTLLNDEDLVAEMSAYSVEVTRSGKVTYNASVGHDDLVMATLIAFNSLDNGEYLIN